MMRGLSVLPPLGLKTVLLSLALPSSLALGTVAYARHPAAPAPPAPAAGAAHQAAPSTNPTSSPGSVARESPFTRLEPVRFSNLNTKGRLELRLYDASGRVDPTAATRLDELLGDVRDPHHVAIKALDRRLLQLVYRAAYHFRRTRIEVISAYRQPLSRGRHGLHAAGKAIDFKLDGVPATALASYLRTLPRVGVGVYTHPRTQYVHLDVRKPSFYWIDASPPNRKWRELPIRDSRIAARDAAYTTSSDLPE